ncbi:substrate-binding domain-containing protein [Pseudorhodoferax sp.]|uniref:substrate-binding domain-containing protein n=1 Tax=Pseudorhodoferax sp. TaxID=1993553 RepID=UPI002DD684DC|nr:substrate-binding domain-containing protein [Pseudorhodoferax sp.]
MSLKQIANELGLSLTTVSRAMNGYPEVARATRDAVLAAAARLGYAPDPRARGLALGRADAVGLVFPITPSDLGDALFLAVAAALSTRLAQAGMDLLIVSTTAGDEVDAYRRAIRGRHIGAFVVPRTRVHDPRLQLLQDQGVPFVAYGRSAGLAQPYAWLDFDNARGARLATRRLLELGHRRIAYLGASAQYNFAALRFGGFAEAMAEAGLAADPALVLRDALDRRSGYGAMQRLLASPAPPSAVLIDNHLAGVGAVHAALQAGVRLGRDLSIIVYDGLGMDSVIRCAITAVEQPRPEQTGQLLAELALARLEGADPATLQRLCDPQLVPGDSDGPVGA